MKVGNESRLDHITWAWFLVRPLFTCSPKSTRPWNLLRAGQLYDPMALLHWQPPNFQILISGQVLNDTAIPEDCLSVMLNVESLCTNINNDDGLKALLTEWVDIFFSASWVCTGACFASISATLFLGLLEKDFVQHNVFCDKIKWWRCYIENMLFWTISKQELFCAFQNTNNRNIKFCTEYSSNSIIFLDVNIWKGEYGQLHTTVLQESMFWMLIKSKILSECAHELGSLLDLKFFIKRKG